ncbi:hypothetical protein C823_003536 [Eubacterium plexicaudatum ASF492]|uniref:Uncharacterized protein n=1 Tax=Eubacterium plexicaudatum ASF492 TaxID=1235802 RepID=N2AVF1_9FIRM|nr:hypothetical protein C823_003536 [Eubacterium plexicaudatum ASF492]
MGRFIYRMCLVLVLAIVVAGGVYYYTSFYQKEEQPKKGTFVYVTDEEGDYFQRKAENNVRPHTDVRILRSTE